jgi:hypothetical protein
MSHITGTILSIFSNTCNTVKSVSVDSLCLYYSSKNLSFGSDFLSIGIQSNTNI